MVRVWGTAEALIDFVNSGASSDDEHNVFGAPHQWVEKELR